MPTCNSAKLIGAGAAMSRNRDTQCPRARTRTDCVELTARDLFFSGLDRVDAQSQNRDLSLPTIVIVDKDASTRARIREFMTTNGLAVREAHSLATMRRAVDASCDVVIADASVTREHHAALLGAIRAMDELTSIVLLVRSATLDQATAAVRQGADHLLKKPVDLVALLIVVQRLVERQQARRRAAAATTDARRPPDPFLGDSRVIKQLAEQAHRILQSNAPILVQGETGTGKGVLASWLHLHSPRAEEPFVDINCASLSRELLESELFGHERGAFTGAADQKLGLFEVAHRGTVFLDEIGEMRPPSTAAPAEGSRGQALSPARRGP